ncbi:MAG: helix-hairpin-helix domain-containing protein [Oscillospiraceae bacterium]|nr:helix-hairpin-helix domain-containing protein [Oscillospiraceae bacterium]
MPPSTDKLGRLIRYALGLLCAAALGVGVVCLIESRPSPFPDYNAAARAVPSIVSDRTGGRLDLNAANAALLDDLPGIGSALALRIIEYRSLVGSFTDERELNRVNGIGVKTSEKIYPLVYAGE